MGERAAGYQYDDQFGYAIGGDIGVVFAADTEGLSDDKRLQQADDLGRGKAIITVSVDLAIFNLSRGSSGLLADILGSNSDSQGRRAPRCNWD